MSPKLRKLWLWKEVLIGIIIGIAASIVLEVKIHHIYLCGTEAFALRDISARLRKQIYRL